MFRLVLTFAFCVVMYLFLLGNDTRVSYYNYFDLFPGYWWVNYNAIEKCEVTHCTRCDIA